MSSIFEDTWIIREGKIKALSTLAGSKEEGKKENVHENMETKHQALPPQHGIDSICIPTTILIKQTGSIKSSPPCQPSLFNCDGSINKYLYFRPDYTRMICCDTLNTYQYITYVKSQQSSPKAHYRE